MPLAHAQVCVLTPFGRGAIAVVKVAGTRATELVGGLFQRTAGPLKGDWPLHRIYFGTWSETGEELIVCRTGPEEVEVHCHGGEAAAAAIARSLGLAGASVADWAHSSWETSGDLITAEAALALSQATTERTAVVLLDQYRGALRSALAEVSAHFKQERWSAAQAGVGDLLSRASLGLHLTSPWRVALVGRPNVGKSSLLNALIGFERTIVHAQPGTTRDVVWASTALDGWPVELADTAGIRDAQHALEAQGIARARRVLQEADAALVVVDATQSLEVDGEFSGLGIRQLCVANKCDLIEPGRLANPPWIGVSARTGTGLHRLQREISALLVPSPPAVGAAVPFTSRQVALLQKTAEDLARRDWASAAHSLGGM